MKAVREPFEGSYWQRCQTHFSRNLLEKISPSIRPEIKALLTELYSSPDFPQARRRRDELIDEFNEGEIYTNFLDLTTIDVEES